MISDLRRGSSTSPRPPKIRMTEDRGIALTPYSYERLDNLKGYESGMPNPGFYHQAWSDGPQAGDRATTHRAGFWPGLRRFCGPGSSPSARPT